MKTINEILVSIIVPVYNSEKYLDECLNSLCNQTLKEIEIILVDDGSEDSCGIICEQWSEKDERIKVIHQSNQGQNAARKTGVLNANGKYIGFVDSDDWIEPEMYENLTNNIGNNDMITSAIIRHGKDDVIVDEWVDLFDEGEYTTDDSYFISNLVINSRYESGVVMGGVTNNLVNKMFIADKMKYVITKYDVHVRYEEDLLLWILYVINANKVRITHSKYYHYRSNMDSVTNNAHDVLSDKAKLCGILRDVLKNDSKYSSLLSQYQRRCLYYMYCNVNLVLGIESHLDFPKYIYPNSELIAGKKVVVFGAGNVGCAYWNYFNIFSICHVEKWVDNKSNGQIINGVAIENPSVIIDVDYDFIICATIRESNAIEMKEQLIDMGVKKEIILWEKPVNIWMHYFLKNKIG